jgi:hypothetical protein
MRASRTSRKVPWGIVGLTTGAVVVLGSVLALRARSADPAPEPSTAKGAGSAVGIDSVLGGPDNDVAPTGSVGSTPVLAGDVRSQVLGAKSLTDAVAVARPFMVNTVGRVDSGSALLALWASGNMTWEALDAIPQTSAAMFNKDPDAERGKRLCITGKIVEIRAERSLSARLIDDRSAPLIVARAFSPGSAATDAPSDSTARPQDSSGAALLPFDSSQGALDWSIPNGGKLFFAMMKEKRPETATLDDTPTRQTRKPNRDELLVEVIAAKSSGMLVDQSEARACGILTGVTLPSTGSASLPPDVTQHRIVGLFELPQNKGDSRP